MVIQLLAQFSWPRKPHNSAGNNSSVELKKHFLRYISNPAKVSLSEKEPFFYQFLYPNQKKNQSIMHKE